MQAAVVSGSRNADALSPQVLGEAGLPVTTMGHIPISIACPVGQEGIRIREVCVGVEGDRRDLVLARRAR